jgi:hypothetical protein
MTVKETKTSSVSKQDATITTMALFQSPHLRGKQVRTFNMVQRQELNMDY